MKKKPSVVSVLHRVEGAFGAASGGTPKMKNLKEISGVCRIRSAGIGPCWGEKFVAQSLHVHLLCPVRCLACMLNLRVVARGDSMTSKPRSQRILSGNAGKNRTAHAQLVPIIFGASYFQSWIAQICFH